VIVEYHADHQAAAVWFGRELVPLLATAETAAAVEDDPAVWLMAWAMENYLQRHRFWAEWEHTQKLALAAALRIGEAAAQARVRDSLGVVYSPRALNVPAEARIHLWEAVRLFGVCGDNVGLATAYARLVDVLGPEDPDRSEILRTGLAVWEQAQRDGLGSRPDADARAVELAVLPVHFHLELGEFAAALPYALRCVALLRGTGNQHSEALAYCNLAEIRIALGDRVGALAAMDESVRLFIERGDLFMAARTLERLGRTEAAAGRQLPAITRLRWALALFRCLGLTHAEPVQSLIADLLPRA
jgi:tetratricopeptide (TPR) repeat protein